MALRDLFSRCNELLLDPERFGIEGSYLDPSTSPATPVPVTGILQILGIDPLINPQEGDRLMEQATFDIPVSLNVDQRGSFSIDGQLWKIAGLGGRDNDLQTILIQRPVIYSTRTAKRRA